MKPFASSVRFGSHGGDSSIAMGVGTACNQQADEIESPRCAVRLSGVSTIEYDS